MWKKFYGGTGDTRSFRWSAKPTPPVRTSFDHFVDNGENSYTAAREAAAVKNQEVMDRRRAEDARQEGIIRLTVRNQQRNMHREAAAMRARGQDCF